MTTRTFALGVMGAPCLVAQGAAQTEQLQGDRVEGKKIASRWKQEP